MWLDAQPVKHWIFSGYIARFPKKYCTTSSQATPESNKTSRTDFFPSRAPDPLSPYPLARRPRPQLIPVNRRYRLERLSEVLRTHFPRNSKPKKDEFTAAVPLDGPEDLIAGRSAENDDALPATTAGDGADVAGRGAARLSAAAGQSVETANGSGQEEETAVAELPTSKDSGQPTPSAGRDSKRHVGGGRADDDRKDRSPRRPRRKSWILAVEYTLLRGVNDSLEDAGRLADWLEGVACVVNLITFNAHEGTPFGSSSVETSEAFRQALAARGQLCTFRDSRGDDGMAACG